MIHKRVGALLLALLLAFSLAACGNKDKTATQEPTPVAEPAPVTPDETADPDRYTVIPAADAAALVTERLPLEGGYTTLTQTGFAIGKKGDADYHEYFAVNVKDASGADYCQVAVDGATGELLHYLGDNNIAPFSESPLYDPARDAVVSSWDGAFALDSVTVTLTQEDASSLTFVSSDGVTTGTARISGDAASSEDGKFVFLLEEDGSILTIAGDNQLVGKYALQDSAATTPPADAATTPPAA